MPEREIFFQSADSVYGKTPLIEKRNETSRLYFIPSVKTARQKNAVFACLAPPAATRPVSPGV
jgi:hypothetical protein